MQNSIRLWIRKSGNIWSSTRFIRLQYHTCPAIFFVCKYWIKQERMASSHPFLSIFIQSSKISQKTVTVKPSSPPTAWDNRSGGKFRNELKRSSTVLGWMAMTSTELKHQAQIAKWTELIEECRSNGLPVKTWCQQAQITPSTYYRWERNVLASAETNRLS